MSTEDASVWTAVGLLGAGVALGGAAGYFGNPTASSKPSSGAVGAVLGALVVTTGGAAVAAVHSEKWERTGELVALMGIASFTSLALLSTFSGLGSSSSTQIAGAKAPAPALPPSSPTPTPPTTETGSPSTAA